MRCNQQVRISVAYADAMLGRTREYVVCARASRGRRESRALCRDARHMVRESSTVPSPGNVLSIAHHQACSPLPRSHGRAASGVALPDCSRTWYTRALPVVGLVGCEWLHPKMLEDGLENGICATGACWVSTGGARARSSAHVIIERSRASAESVVVLEVRIR